MKRGKDEDRIMGPMFPRLHVNDTEKGGPRAPPRNKMALYEQLSTPSERFNTESLPVIPNNSINLLPPASSSQGSGHERSTFLPVQLPPSVHPCQNPHACYTGMNPSLVQTNPKKRQVEDDFTVPIFNQSNMGQDHCQNNSNIFKERLSPFSPAYSSRFMKFQSNSEKGTKEVNYAGINIRQEDSWQSVENSKNFVASTVKSNNSGSNQSQVEKSEAPLRQTYSSSIFEHKNHSVGLIHRLNSTSDNLQHVYKKDSHPNKTLRGDDFSSERVSGMDCRNSSILMGDLQHEERRSPHNPTSAESREDRCRSVQTGILDKGDDASETSMVDSISGMYLSPDDVVGMIGLKHFWKARRAIVNQQRVFSIQVFELHRLIKVQRLIAKSPDIMVEDNVYTGKPPKGFEDCHTHTNELQLEYIVKDTSKIATHKDVPENPILKTESSAENAVGKTSLPPFQNGSQAANHGQYLGSPPPTTVVNNDAKMGSWNFNQPADHQWLIPVVTPSEGLVYKPYPGPGFMRPVLGPSGSTPPVGNFLNYGVPVPLHHYQGLGAAPFTRPAGGQGYFIPYGLPVMHPSFPGSVEQMNHLNMQNQASCNVPAQKNGAVPNGEKLNPSKGSEVQVSTASRTSDKGRNALPLFPTSPVPDGAADQPTRVIKVVPHNARSATESVARIFQSIQEERKQYDSV